MKKYVSDMPDESPPMKWLASRLDLTINIFWGYIKDVATLSR